MYEPRDQKGAYDLFRTAANEVAGNLAQLAIRDLKNPTKRYARAGAIQLALEKGLFVPCGAVTIAIGDVDTWVDRLREGNDPYLNKRIAAARRIRRVFVKTLHGHSEECEGACLLMGG
jgi:hypothetical protein